MHDRLGRDNQTAAKSRHDGNAIIETDLRPLDYILGDDLNIMKKKDISTVQTGSAAYSPPNQYRYGNAAEVTIA